MTTPELTDNGETVLNGAFLATIEPLAAQTSDLAGAVNTVDNRYFGDGELQFALAHIKDQNTQRLSDYWQNNALNALAINDEASGFNDTTSNFGHRTAASYLTSKLHPLSPRNPLNADERFPDRRPLGFTINEEDQPVMALVALDPSKLDPQLTQHEKDTLIDEVKTLRIAVTDDLETVRTDALNGMSTKLRGVLSSCLLANDTFVSSQDEQGDTETWELPFDAIASLKALYTLLSGAQFSAFMRQGAVRASNAQGQEIIVGGSGLNSAIDEMVARNFAQDVLDQEQGNHESNRGKIDIATAELNDIPEISVHLEAVYADAYPNDRGITRDMFEGNRKFQRVLRIYLAQQLRIHSATLLLARNDSGIVGTIGVKPDRKNPKTAEIWGFYVNPDEQDSGIGKELWQKLMESNEVKGLEKLELTVAKDSKVAKAFYERQGFVVTGEEDWDWPNWTDEHPHNQYWKMEKQL